MLKIFNLGKANAEIDRLAKELADANTKIADMEANAGALEKAAEEANAKAEKAEAEAKRGFEDREKAITKERDDARAEAAKAKSEADAKCADFDAKVQKAAAEKSAATVASFGVAPSTATTNTQASDFASLVSVELESKKAKTKAEAIQNVIRNNPAAYNEWRKGDTSKL